jgi:signal transduction histidine kinase
MDPKKNKASAFKKTDEEANQELDELKARFLSIAAHEFKTPLTGILSSLNLIDRYLDADSANWAQFRHHGKVESHLAKIKESATNLSGILNKFLSIDTIEKGQVPLKRSEIDLKRMIGRQVRQMQMLAKPGQEIIYSHTSEQTKATTDKYMLRNILNNLLSNAIKFSHEKTEISLLSTVDPETIRIELTDQGVGIPEAEQNKVFQQFYRAGNANINEEGTGLGLFIVTRYVNWLGGSIDLKSKINEGTTIKLILPNKPIHEKGPGH